MKFDPISKEKPTVADLAKQGDQLHECLEHAHQKIDNVTVVVDEIKTGLGLGPDGRKPAGLSSPFRAFVRTAAASATSIGGLILGYKLVLVLIPVVALLLHSVDIAIRTGRL